MGPSQAFLVLFSCTACALAMMPTAGLNRNFGITSGMPNSGAAGSSIFGGRPGGMMALQYQLYDRKRSMMKHLIKLYEKHGCVDPMQKFSSEYIPAAITMVSGCSSPNANISCRQYGMQKMNFQTILMQNAMPQQQQQKMTATLRNMSPYNLYQNILLGRGGMNPLSMRMVYGTEGPGSGLAFSSERLDMVRNARMRYLPFQCQDIRAGNLEMGLCCPGPVDFNPQVEMRVFADLINV